MFSFATSKGSICLVDLTSKNTDFQVYNEHTGNIITTMKWNEQSNELFAGDNTGKISVMTYTNFIVSYLGLIWFHDLTYCFYFRQKQCFKILVHQF